MIGKIVITFCIEKSSTLKNNIFLFRIYYLSMEAHELFLNTKKGVHYAYVLRKSDHFLYVLQNCNDIRLL